MMCENRWFVVYCYVKISNIDVIKTASPRHRLILCSFMISAGSGPFAFHVVLNQDITGLEHSQIIPFGTVVTNDGQAYDKNSGVFRCQQDGTYLFAVTVVVYPRKGTELSLVKNGVGIGDVYAQSNSDRYDSGSNVFIVQLQVGDQVFVQVHDHYHGTGNVIDASFTTFSGFLIN